MNIKTCIIHIDVQYISMGESEALSYSNLDSLSQSEFDEFTVNVYAVLDSSGFDVVNIQDSGRSNTSCYYTAIKKDEEEKRNIKCVLFIRASDHPWNNDEKVRKKRAEYYKKQALNYKLPEYKKRQDWKLINVVVDGRKLQTYDEALQYLKNRLMNL